MLRSNWFITMLFSLTTRAANLQFCPLQIESFGILTARLFEIRILVLTIAYWRVVSLRSEPGTNSNNLQFAEFVTFASNEYWLKYKERRDLLCSVASL